MNIRHRDKKLRFKLDTRLKTIIIGTLLGDANLNRRGSNYRLLIKHGESQQPLIEWKRKQLEAITGMKINRFSQEVKGKPYRFCQFVTLTHPDFTDLHKVFYRGRKKVVPANIKELITDPLALAVWLMDDGAKAGAGMTIQTHSFFRNGVERLRKLLKDNFRLNAALRKNKNRIILYIPKSEIPKLKMLVEEYILPEYRYKFP
ncbi:hypothetical protein HY477_01620 [Candidatus Uhrbacteria bacterium]|nr:hypothetical protein [Candidatus Uhrbacteria bacterium]